MTWTAEMKRLKRAGAAATERAKLGQLTPTEVAARALDLENERRRVWAVSNPLKRKANGDGHHAVSHAKVPIMMPSPAS